MYINFESFSFFELQNASKLYEFVKMNIPKGKKTYLLLDEIQDLSGYELVSENLYNLSGGDSNWKFKAVITSSSPAHICSLANGKLGGSRGKLFYLPPITFVEYLYFVDRITSYNNYSAATSSDFKDYLTLKGIPSDMMLTFNRGYFVNYYDMTQHSNKSGRTNRSQYKLQEGDLLAFAGLLAYQLSEESNYETIIHPDIGTSELRNEMSPTEIAKLDFSNTLISLNVNVVKLLKSEDRARLIEFLINSRIVNIETVLETSLDNSVSEHQIMNLLQSTTNYQDLFKFFQTVTLAVNSPLLYTRLGEDILNIVGLTMNDLWKNKDNNKLLGKMLEVYIRGAFSQLNCPLVAFSSAKLNYPVLGEVDVYQKNLETPLMCESAGGTQTKKPDRLLKYFPDEPMIRICTTDSHSDDIYGYHRIPYAQLCCMIDTGDVMKLPKSTIADVNKHLSDK